MRTLTLAATALAILTISPTVGRTAERTERFDKDPNWEGNNNRRAQDLPPIEVRQDFGYSKTNHAGGATGEIGGLVTPTAEPAWYGKIIDTATLDTPLSASGTLVCRAQPFHALVGFFNADTLNEWRTPNTIALRINGRGEVFFAYLEYATSKWRAGGDHPKSFPATRNSESGRSELIGFSAGTTVHRWSLAYDPKAAGGRGALTATIDGASAVCELDADHRQDGARMNRFGILNVMKSVDTGGEFWLDDITIGGVKHDFSTDPGWDASRNRGKYATRLVRPWFDFGWTESRFAGGQAAGELGGVVFRGDCREALRMAHYADRLQELSLDKPLRAGGKIALRRGVSDSGVLLGFFNARASTISNPSQKSGLPKQFLGISTDAPSRQGFGLTPVYRFDDASGAAPEGELLRLYPDGKSHDWLLVYDPTGAEGRGVLELSLDGRSVRLPLGEEHRAEVARFDRFGIISTWVDGNSQSIYFDDLTYTAEQP